MINQLENMEYKANNPLLTTLVASFMATGSVFAGYIPNQSINYTGMVHENYDYQATKQSTHISNIITNNIVFDTSTTIEKTIIEKIDSVFGYKVLDIEKSSLTDDEGTFSIYTMLLDLETRDYSKLLDEEWELSEQLGLYEQNIILRFV